MPFPSQRPITNNNGGVFSRLAYYDFSLSVSCCAEDYIITVQLLKAFILSIHAEQKKKVGYQHFSPTIGIE